MKLIIGIYFLMFSTITLSANIIVFSKGTVKNQTGKKLKKGDAVNLGDKITASGNSLAVIKLESGSKIKVGADTEVVVEKLPAPKKPETSILLRKGAAFLNVKKKSGHKFNLKTRSVSMGVRGTEFFASFGTTDGKQNKDVWMCVNEGQVVVTNKSEKKAVLVKEGEGIVVKGGAKTSNPKPLKWTRKLNWNMDPTSGDLVNSVSIEAAYADLLDEDYD